MAVNITTIADGIADTIRVATGIKTKQSWDELSEGINNKDCPLIQVYWEELQMDALSGGDTDRSSFGGAPPVKPMRQKWITFHADLYTSRRNQITQNWTEVHQNIDSILDALEGVQQDRKPYFGVDGIKAWQLVSATRAMLDYGGPEVTFPGIRFVIAIRVF